MEAFCPDDSCIYDNNIWANIKDNMFPIFSKIEPVAEYLFKSEDLSDSEIIRMCDIIGDAYGAIVSYVIGFDQRFTTSAATKKSIWFEKEGREGGIFKYTFID